MSLSFITPAKAKNIADTIVKSKDPKEISSIINKIKTADNEKELSAVYSSEVPKIERKPLTPPANYRPITFQQRKDWNKYLEYLGSIGVQGSAELDKGVPTKGITTFKKYLKENPNSSLNDYSSPVNLVKAIQYEMSIIRKGQGGFPELDDSELIVLQNFLLITRNKFMNTRTSDQDGNPGQYTTMCYYPEFSGSVDYAKKIDNIKQTLSSRHGINPENMK
jgi:hypothetical protein